MKMKPLILTVFSLICTFQYVELHAQNAQLQENLEKYWHFRENLKTEFMYYTNSAYTTPGANIVAENVKYLEFMPYNQGPEFVRWADAPFIHGHYLGVLALEYYLLKENRQDVTETLNELAQALYTYVRLDLSAETVWGWNATHYNGFFLRDDVDDTGPAAQYFSGKEIKSDWVDGYGEMNTVSQDQVWGMLLGLRLIHRLVDNQSILDVAANIASTLMYGMHSNSYQWPIEKRWGIKNPCTGNPVPRGGEWYEVSTQCWAFAKAAGIVSDQNEHYSYSDKFKFVFKAVQLANEDIFNGTEFTISLYLVLGIPVDWTLILEGKPYSAYGNALLSCLINEPAAPDNTYDWLVRCHNDHIGYHEYPGVWPHLPAISYVLYGYDGNEFLDRSFYEDIYLDSCPPCGAYHYNSEVEVLRTDPPWHGMSLFSPMHVFGEDDFGGHYNMLDYMLLYTSYFYNYNRGDLPIFLYVESVSQNESVSAARQIDAVSQSHTGYQNNFTAGQAIRLLPGFQANAGSEVRFSIDPDLNYPIYFAKTTNNPCEEVMRANGSNRSQEDSLDGRKKLMSQRGLEAANKDFSNSTTNQGIEPEGDIIVYPNPSNGAFKVKNVIGFKHYEIYSSYGELIECKSINSSQISINLSSVKNGLYILKFKADTNSAIIKISVAQ
ncbi:MAG: T9SS type A sorting domain-containing protein [Bacteroidales bacterium]|nr:T9SS type A sorting domain-containing protein [Bacteroidales bacterium]